MHTTSTNLIAGFLNTELATEVYSGPIAISGLLLEFVFSAPYQYTGTNLLIDITTTPGEPRNIIFYGTSTSELSRYSFTFEGVTYNSTHPFTPKTTFEYTTVNTNSYTITATASAGGTITPTGDVVVLENQNKRFDFYPNMHYVLSKVLIDGAENPQAVSDGYYTFTNITDNHTIHAEFEPETAVVEKSLQDIKVYAYQNSLYVINEQQVPLKKIDIFDIIGRTIYSSSVVTSSMNLNFAKGVYMVRLINDDYVNITKIIIQ
jgi:hypothetical protein